MPAEPTPQPHYTQPKNTHWLLRRADQVAIAGLALFALVAMAWYWIAQGGLSGRLIEIEHANQVTADFKVDVNTADWTELTTLPEVGQGTAQRIVDYRKQHGPFEDVEDLRNVRGIGPKTLERLRPYLLLPGAAASPSNAPAPTQSDQAGAATAPSAR